MTAILSLLVVVTLSILITRIATIALTQTGLSKESARFQARSALSGAGFTTSESESVVSHPVRRRIITILILLGNAGIVGAASALILGFVGNSESSSATFKIVVLFAGLTILWALAQSQWLDRRLSRLIEWALCRYTRLEVRDFSSLLRLSGEYRIVEIHNKSRGLARKPDARGIATAKRRHCGARHPTIRRNVYRRAQA